MQGLIEFLIFRIRKNPTSHNSFILVINLVADHPLNANDIKIYELIQANAISISINFFIIDCEVI